MFSRAALHPGTPPYDSYYAAHPERRDVDDALRRLTPLMQPGSSFYDPDVMQEAAAYFEAIDVLRVAPGWVEAGRQALAQATDPAALLKDMARALGAVAAGWSDLDPAFIYSHKGRFPHEHGDPVELDHPRVLVFLVEMDWQEMQRAPKAPTLRESAHQYFRAAHISAHLEALLRAAGYAARQHYDAHYDLILPPLAANAGLGELGRNNILIADRRGSRVRIGAVSTDFPATPDRPRSLGARAFCAECRKCAENCPSKALSLDEPVVVRGVSKWPTDAERCYRYWRHVGTDCGICMASCPFSHQDDAFHNLVRWLVRNCQWTHRFLVWADAAVYGRLWRPKP